MDLMRLLRRRAPVPPAKPDPADMLLRRGMMLHNRDMAKAKAYRDKNLKLFRGKA